MSTDERGSAGDDAGLGPDERAVVDRGREWILNNGAELIDLLTTLLSKPSVTGLEGGHDDPDTVVGALPSYLADRFPERESVIAGAEAVLELTVRQLGVA